MPQATSSKTRLYILAAVVIIAMLSLAVRLYMVQIVHGDEFRERASKQYTRSTGATNERGAISLTAKDGTKRTVALQQSGSLLAVNGQILNNPQAAYQKLQEEIELDREKFLQAVSDTDDPYIVVKNRLSKQVGMQINQLNIPGVSTYPQKWRRYPLGSLGSHAIGFVGFSGSSTKPTGIYGAEKYYNDLLDRDPGGLYTNFFARVFNRSSSTPKAQTNTRSGSVNLTIEPDVQTYLETQLKETKEEWNAKQTMGVVIEPQTGAIEALGVKPDYNPNEYETVDDPDVFVNPLVKRRYEMGSIIKSLTMAAGLDAGVVTPETKYNDEGELTLNESTIANYDGVARGRVSMQEVLNQSLNTGAAFVADQLGHKNMRSYFRGWLQGQTDIDLPGEISNDISNLKVKRDLEFATAAFGQGVALTPISTVRALTTLANGGRLVRPHVTNSIEYRLGGVEEVQPSIGERVISEEASDTISRMLAQVVDDAMSEWSRERHSIAAKTGTAQISKPGGGYYEDKFNHTFFGYFPAYEPRYLVFLMARQPEDVKYASQTLSKPFMRMADFLINYYNIPPDR